MKPERTPSSASPLPYAPELTGLRGLAILGVVLFHIMPARWPARDAVPWASGVTLFFVLSAFLTTSRLLRARGAGQDRSPSERWAAWRGFYRRRYLKLLPPYYLLLAVLALANLAHVRETWLWHACFLSNFVQLTLRPFDSEVAPLWFLSALEQFYFVWPLLALFAPRRGLVRLTWLMAAAGPATRAGCLALGYPGGDALLWPTSNLDALGLGALLALQREGWLAGGACPRLLRLLGPRVGLPLFYAAFLLDNVFQRHNGLYETAGVLGQALFFAWVVEAALRGFPVLVRGALAAGPLLFLGRISYSLYLFHPLASQVAAWFAGTPRWTAGSSLGDAAALLAVAFALGAAGWALVERPLDAIRKK